MKRFCRKPEFFEAVQFVGGRTRDGGNYGAILSWLGSGWPDQPYGECPAGATGNGSFDEFAAIALWMRASESFRDNQWALPGDWILKDVKGEFFACKPDIFAITYEEAQ